VPCSVSVHICTSLSHLLPATNKWYSKSKVVPKVMNSSLWIDLICTTQTSWRAKKFLRQIKGSKLIRFFTFKGNTNLEKKLNRNNFGIAGQIKSFRGPHLARGPYVVHVWVRAVIFNFLVHGNLWGLKKFGGTLTLAKMTIRNSLSSKKN